MLAGCCYGKHGDELMRRVLLALITAMTVAVSLCAAVGFAGPAAAAKTVTLTLHAVDRDGNAEPLSYGDIFTEAGSPAAQINGSTYSLAPGQYCIATIVQTVQQGQVISNTVVVREISLSRDMTVTLSAEGSVPVTVSLNGAPVSGVNAGVSLELPGGLEPLISEVQTAVLPLYVEPYQAGNLVFGYLATAAAPGGGSYYLAGSSTNGIPDDAGGSFTTTSLASVTVGAAAGTLRPWSGHAVLLSFTGPGDVTDNLQQIPDGSAVTDYLSPGSWTLTGQQLIPDSGSWIDTRRAHLAAGHSYSETFFSAAFGPSLSGAGAVYVGKDRFVSGGAKVSLELWHLFADPDAVSPSGAPTAARAVVTLSRHGRVLKRRQYRNLNFAGFSANVGGTGWYTLVITATRPGPSSLLSPKVTSVWRFRSPAGATSQAQYPLSFATLLPQGLGLNNEAAPEDTTAVDVREVLNYHARARLPRGDHWKSLTVQASFNGGATWHRVPLVRTGGLLQAIVNDPASGFVSLRVTAVNRAGESAQQTIYKAYAVG
jgi:hypothetical protein